MGYGVYNLDVKTKTVVPAMKRQPAPNHSQGGEFCSLAEAPAPTEPLTMQRIL